MSAKFPDEIPLLRASRRAVVAAMTEGGLEQATPSYEPHLYGVADLSALKSLSSKSMEMMCRYLGDTRVMVGCASGKVWRLAEGHVGERWAPLQEIDPVPETGALHSGLGERRLELTRTCLFFLAHTVTRLIPQEVPVIARPRFNFFVFAG